MAPGCVPILFQKCLENALKMTWKWLENDTITWQRLTESVRVRTGWVKNSSKNPRKSQKNPKESERMLKLPGCRRCIPDLPYICRSFPTLSRRWKPSASIPAIPGIIFHPNFTRSQQMAPPSTPTKKRKINRPLHIHWSKLIAILQRIPRIFTRIDPTQ